MAERRAYHDCSAERASLPALVLPSAEGPANSGRGPPDRHEEPLRPCHVPVWPLHQLVRFSDISNLKNKIM